VAAASHSRHEAPTTTPKIPTTHLTNVMYAPNPVWSLAVAAVASQAAPRFFVGDLGTSTLAVWSPPTTFASDADPLSWLREAPKIPSAKSLRKVLERLAYLCALELGTPDGCVTRAIAAPGSRATRKKA
jgi:hypothetical protein